MRTIYDTRRDNLRALIGQVRWALGISMVTLLLVSALHV